MDSGGSHNLSGSATSIVQDVELNVLFKEFLLFSASTILYQGSRFGVSLFVAGRVDVEVFGLWNALSLVLVYAGIFSLGIIPAMNREVPFFYGKGDIQEAARVRAVSWGWIVCSSLVVGFCLLGVPPFTPLPSGTKEIIEWMAPLFVADQLYAYFQTHLKSDKRFDLLSHQQLLFAGLLPLTAIPLVTFYGLKGYIVGQALVMVMLCAFTAGVVSFQYRVALDGREILRLAKIGTPLLGASFFVGLLVTVDRWVILAFLGVRALGYFSLVILSTGFLALIPGAISQQLYPRMAETFGRTASYGSLKPWVTLQIVAILGTMIPIVISVYFLLPAFVKQFLPQYMPGLAAAKVALLGLVFLSLAGGAANVVSVVNKQVQYIAIQGVAVLINLGLNITFTKLGMGLEGVALGTAASYVLYSLMLNALAFSLMRRRHG